MPRKFRSAAAKKAHDEVFASIMEGAKQAIGILKGEADPATYRVHVPVDVDVKAVRKKTGLSQNAFAGTFGFSAGTVRDWEQRRSTPDRAARVYLWAIGQRPDTMLEILGPLTGTSAAARSKRSRPARSAARAIAAENRPQRKRASRTLGN